MKIDSDLVEHVKKSEGLRLAAYQDTEGVWTIGYGTNLQTLQIDIDTAELWLQERLAAALKQARGYSWFSSLNRARQNVVVDMIYNLGAPRFNGFRKMHAAVAAKKYAVAAKEMLDSRWAVQVKGRAIKLAEIMEIGVWQQ